MAAEDEIMLLNERMLQAEESGDVEQFEPILAENFTILRSNGERQDREAFLQALESNKNRGRRIEQPHVQLADNTALYTCIVEIIRNQDGTPTSQRFLNSRMFVQLNSEWRCVAWQVTRIAQPDDKAIPPKREKVMSNPKPISQTDRSDQEAIKAQLHEIIMEHFGIPRPGQSKHINTLQDTLLPAFIQNARYTLMAASPYQTPSTSNNRDPLLAYLHNATEISPSNIRTLNDILEELGVHGLLEELAASPQLAALAQMPLDPYEARLLRAIGHERPQEAPEEYLRFGLQHPHLLSTSEAQLEKAVDASLQTHSQMTTIININVPAAKAARPSDSEQKKPNRRKLFSGLGTLFSGLVLTTGNAIFIPSIPFTAATVIPIAGSLAAGIAAIGKGAGELLGEEAN